LPDAQERALGLQRDRVAGQISLFEAVAAPSEADLPDLKLEEMPEHEILKSEKQLLGIYLSGHPLSEHSEELALFSTACTSDISERENLTGLRVGGVITHVARKNTRNGDRMAIITLEDMEGQVEVVIFPEMYRNNLSILQEERILIVRGDGERRGDQVSIRASEIWNLDQARENLIRTVHIHLKALGLEEELLLSLRERIQRHRGNARLIIHVQLSDEDEVVISAGDQYQVRPGPALERAMGELFSEPRIRYELNGNHRGRKNGH